MCRTGRTTPTRQQRFGSTGSQSVLFFFYSVKCSHSLSRLEILFISCSLLHLIQPYSGWGILLSYRLWGHIVPPFRFSFICCPITTKPGMVVLWVEYRKLLKTVCIKIGAVSSSFIYSYSNVAETFNTNVVLD